MKYLGQYIALFLGLVLTPAPEATASNTTVTGPCPDCYTPVIERVTSFRESKMSDPALPTLQNMNWESAVVVHGLSFEGIPSPGPSGITNPGPKCVQAIVHKPTPPHHADTIQIVRDCHGNWQWQDNGQPILMRQGVDYQPTEGPLDINYYIDNHHLDRLMAQILPDDEAKKIDPSFTGRDQGAQLQAHGFTTIRLYQAPLENPTDIIQFKQVMRRAYQLYGIRVNLGDFLGLYLQDPVLRKDPAQMMQRVLRLGRLYGNEPWVASFTLGNENDLYLRGAPLAGDFSLDMSADDYYHTMDKLAAALKEVIRGSRPVLLGHGQPQSPAALGFLAGLTNFDGVGFNLFEDAPGLQTELGDLQQINDMRKANHLPELPFLLNEFGQNLNFFGSLTESARATTFADQINVLDFSPLIAGRYALEATNEQWKVATEGQYGGQYGILGQPDVEQTFSDHRETPPEPCST